MTHPDLSSLSLLISLSLSLLFRLDPLEILTLELMPSDGKQNVLWKKLVIKLPT